MSKKVVKNVNKKKKVNGYEMPEPIPKGEVLTDIGKQRWIIGTSIGVGGFGEIYTAAPYDGTKATSDYTSVIKIEPHGNGPLFVEMHFYMRNAKSADIAAWTKQKKLAWLGMPRFISSGSHDKNGTKYRFVVMDRFGKDVWKMFDENGRKFPEHTVYKISLQVIDVLAYIHDKGYVHADVKGTNLLLDLKNDNRVNLVDFGLACRVRTEYKPDPKKAHDGTLEYTSRDAHIGAPSMRGDLEILGYNMIHWLGGSLPWEKHSHNLKEKPEVQKLKNKAFDNLPTFLNNCFSPNPVPETVEKYFVAVKSLKFEEAPNYEKFRDLLTRALAAQGHKPDGKLEFAVVSTTTTTSGKSTSVKEVKSKKTEVPKKRKNEDKTTRGESPVKKSPRTKVNQLKASVNLDDSFDGVVMDTKRAARRDLKQALQDMHSDEEYDIKITRKKKTTTTAAAKRDAENEAANSNAKPKRVANVRNPPKKVTNDDSEADTPKRTRTTNRTVRKKYVDSESDDDEVVLSKGTRSRPERTAKKIVTAKNDADSSKDMFESD